MLASKDLSSTKSLSLFEILISNEDLMQLPVRANPPGICKPTTCGTPCSSKPAPESRRIRPRSQLARRAVAGSATKRRTTECVQSARPSPPCRQSPSQYLTACAVPR